MRRLPLTVAAAGVLVAGMLTAQAGPPLPDPNFRKTLFPSPCSATNRYEAAQFAAEGWSGPHYVRYPGACQRLHFAYGPITVKPGQNDVLIGPAAIEKPA